MRGLLFLVLLWAGLAHAFDVSDAEALDLADQPSPQTRQARDWHGFVEGGVGRRNGGAEPMAFGRVSLDLAVDTALAPQWRGIAASRLDLAAGERRDADAVNTLKEIYASYRPGERLILDAGRVNVHYGVAQGYNPTDFFRAGAVRSLISIDPETLRQNRLGSVMLRAQWLGDDSSYTALYSPAIERSRRAASLHPDWGATNFAHRYLLSAGRRFAAWANPELVLYGEEGRPPIIGLNQTALLGDATVIHGEWSGGRSPTMLADATHTASPQQFRSRLAAGLTYTSPSKDMVLLEYHYNGTAPGAGQWHELRNGPAPLNLAFRSYALDRQELPTRHALFFDYRRPDLAVSGLNLEVMSRIDLVDHSSLHWLQLRYVWDSCEAAVQGQLYLGGDRTVFGGTGQASVLELRLRRYF